MDNTTHEICKFLIEVDSIIELNVQHFISNHGLTDNPKFPIKFNVIILSIKLVIYDLLLLLSFSVMKVMFKENAFVTVVFSISLIVAVAATFLTFLGFFQVLFT